MDKPLVTIITPVFRTPKKLLRRFLESFRNQSLTNIELVLVNDASQDHCPAILDEFAANNSNVHVLHRDRNGRAGVCRSQGLRVARGKYVLFADGDDQLVETACEQLYSLGRSSGAEIIASGWSETDGDGNQLREVRLPDLLFDMSIDAERKAAYQTINFALWNKLFRRSLALKIDFHQFEANIGEDTLFNIAAACRSTKFQATSFIGYSYTQHTASATGRTNKGLPYLRTIIESQLAIARELATNDPTNVGRRYLRRLWLRRFCTGCEWIAENPSEHQNELSAFWMEYWHRDVRPALQRDVLLTEFASGMLKRFGPTGSPRAIRRALSIYEKLGKS